MFHSVAELTSGYLEKGKRSLIVIDEAQIIKQEEVFEQIRLLLNLQLEDHFLVAIVLIGQPELRKQIEEYPQLGQRIAVRYHLHGFDLADSTAYIEHRLEVAGSKRQLFRVTSRCRLPVKRCPSRHYSAGAKGGRSTG